MQKILFAFPKKLLAVQCQEVEKRIWGLYFFLLEQRLILSPSSIFKCLFNTRSPSGVGCISFSSKKLVIKVLEKSFIGLQIQNISQHVGYREIRYNDPSEHEELMPYLLADKKKKKTQTCVQVLYIGRSSHCTDWRHSLLHLPLDCPHMQMFYK